MGTQDIEKVYELLYRNFVGENHRDFQLAYIKHERGYMYASNGHILAKIKQNYPEEREGKAFDRKGQSVTSSVDYEKVIPKKREKDYSISNDEINNLRIAARNTYCTDSSDYYIMIDTWQPIMYKGVEHIMAFKAEYLHAAFRLFELKNANPKIRISTSNMIVFESTDGTTILIMPAMIKVKEKEEYIYQTLTVSEAMNYKSKERAWYEEK